MTDILGMPQAIAVVIAACFAGFVSFIGLLISKDAKISEFRQQWIDALRADIADFLGGVISVKTTAQSTEALTLPSGTRQEKISHLDTFNRGISHVTKTYTCIRLRLNPKEHGALLGLLKKATQTLETLDQDYAEAIIVESQRILKNEWSRVKRGEIFYFLFKILLLAAVVFLLVITVYRVGAMPPGPFIYPGGE